MKKNIITLLFACLVGFSSLAQQNFTLEEAIDFATKNNASIKNALLGIEDADQKGKETRAIGLPQISATGSYKHFLAIPIVVYSTHLLEPNAPIDQLSPLNFGTVYNVNASLNVDQMLFNQGYFVGLKSVKKFKEVSAFQKVKTIQDVKENVTKAYYGVLAAEKTITTINEIVTTSQARYSETKAMFDKGLAEVNEDDITQLHLNGIMSQNALKSAKRQLKDAKNLLKWQMGMDVSKTLTLSSAFDTVMSRLNTAQSDVSSDVSQNIDFLLLDKQRELNVLNVKYEKSQYLPSLSAFFSYQQNALRNNFNLFDASKPWYPTKVWGLNLSVPIFSGGTKASKVSQAKIQLKQSENSLAQLKESLSIQTEAAKSTYDNAFDTYTTSKEAVSISKKIYTNYQLKFKEKSISALDLSQTEAQYLAAQNQYIQAMYSLVVAKIELDKITNKL